MRIIFKGFILLFTGLFAAVIVYPILHECGHAIFAFLLGVKIEEINLLSEFYVICRIDDGEIAKAVFVGYAGIIVPIIFTFLFCSDVFIFKYINFTIKIINLIVVANAIFAYVMFMFNIHVYQNDITTILSISPEWLPFTLIVLVLCLIVTTISLFSNNIMADVYFFYVDEKKKDVCGKSNK